MTAKGTVAAVAAAVARNTPASAAGIGWGVITAVTTSTPETVSVSIRAQPTPVTGISCLDNYHPTVGDTVVLVEWPTSTGHDYLVIGSVGAVPTTTPGTIVMHGGTAPTGWLTCDGSSVSKTTYPGLFAAIGYTYGGSGTNFNLPNLAGSFPMGNTPGATGGASSHTHTTDVHTHDEGSHYHGLNSGYAEILVNGTAGEVAAASVYASWSDNGAVAGTAQGTLGSHTSATPLGGSTDYNTDQSTGDGGGGNTSSGSNLPPYVGVRFIIKT